MELKNLKPLVDYCCIVFTDKEDLLCWLAFFFSGTLPAMPSSFGEKLREEVRDIEKKMKKTITIGEGVPIAHPSTVSYAFYAFDFSATDLSYYFFSLLFSSSFLTPLIC
jgi:hypothetical protein